jgi:hypothetical protein
MVTAAASAARGLTHLAKLQKSLGESLREHGKNMGSVRMLPIKKNHHFLSFLWVFGVLCFKAFSAFETFFR